RAFLKNRTTCRRRRQESQISSRPLPFQKRMNLHATASTILNALGTFLYGRPIPARLSPLPTARGEGQGAGSPFTLEGRSERPASAPRSAPQPRHILVSRLTHTLPSLALLLASTLPLLASYPNNINDDEDDLLAGTGSSGVDITHWTVS